MARAEVREFDLVTKAFVPNGLSGPANLGKPFWRDQNSIFLNIGNADGTVTTVIRQRGRPDHILARAKGSAIYPARDNLKRILFHIGSDGERVRILNDNGTLSRTSFPSGWRFMGIVYQGRAIFQLDKPWRDKVRSFPSGSVVAASLDLFHSGRISAELIVNPDATKSIDRIVASRNGITIVGQEAGQGTVRTLSRVDGKWILRRVPFPLFGSMDTHPGLVDIETGRTFVEFQSFNVPPTLFEVDIRHAVAQVVRRQAADKGLSEIIVERRYAISPDGTRIPYMVAGLRSTLTKQAPLILEAYGAYGNSIPALYDAQLLRSWILKGGAYAFAQIRGGAEFGPSWHVTGLKRRHTYEDFIAVAQNLVSRSYTEPSMLGIRGHSAGGALVLVALNMRPDLFNAVVAENPVTDLFRMDLTQTGDAGQRDEWGDPANAADRAFLAETSPIQNMRLDGETAPPFLLTSTTDFRVHPAMSRWYAAKLEHAGRPFFFHEDPEGGHEIGFANYRKNRELEYAYFWQRLDVSRNSKK
ncbi:prolyl oligopeptidase family serine peptidase [Sphingomonas sp.]|uniref:prolyl oligopeptidase family serine peptidase n=1 Tax=Sphingomonas sp. TaxID=28214 RepID=UPI0025F2D83B|nr:prolyl oligopeptidase family serine peptidase [Sphingomonas sp.]